MDNQPDPVTAPTMGVAPYSPSPLPPVPLGADELRAARGVGSSSAWS